MALVGESGAGKSASAMAVVGLLPEYAEVSGSIRLHGDELLGLSDQRMSQIRGRTIGTVFQDPMSALTPVYTVGDQIAEALEVHNRDIGRHAARTRAVELLELVGIAQPERRARSFPHELSGGERQRVVIAIAIANDPDLLICDEPTTALDVTVQAQILEVLKTARDVTGAGVLIITHDLGVVAEFADRALVMYAGRAVETAPVAELYRDRVMPYTVGLLGSVPRLDAPQGARLVPIPGAPPSLAALPPGCPFAPRCPLAIDECRDRRTRADLDRPQAQRRVHPHRSREGAQRRRHLRRLHRTHRGTPAPADAPVVLQVRDLVKTFKLTKGVVFRRQVGEVRAVDGVSFELQQGHTLGIVGESGSGKSTTLHQILELTAPQAGSIEVLGADVATLDRQARRALRGDLQVVFQDPVASLDPRLPVFDVLAEPLQANGFDKSRIDERVAELLGVVGLRREDASRYPAEFSGGQKQRIGIARALGAAAEDPGARRTGFGARRVDPGRHHQPAAGPAAAVRAVLPVRLARPVGGQTPRPSGGGDVQGQDRRAGRRRPGIQPPAARLHQAIACRSSATRAPSQLESVDMEIRRFAVATLIAALDPDRLFERQPGNPIGGR